MTAKATIFGSGDESQIVTVDFESYQIHKFFGDRSYVFITFCNLKESLSITPSDLEEDLKQGIAVSVGEDPDDLRFECEPLIKTKI